MMVETRYHESRVRPGVAMWLQPLLGTRAPQDMRVVRATSIHNDSECVTECNGYR